LNGVAGQSAAEARHFFDGRDPRLVVLGHSSGTDEHEIEITSCIGLPRAREPNTTTLMGSGASLSERPELVEHRVSEND